MDDMVPEVFIQSLLQKLFYSQFDLPPIFHLNIIHLYTTYLGLANLDLAKVSLA